MAAAALEELFGDEADSLEEIGRRLDLLQIENIVEKLTVFLAAAPQDASSLERRDRLLADAPEAWVAQGANSESMLRWLAVIAGVGLARAPGSSRREHRLASDPSA